MDKAGKSRLFQSLKAVRRRKGAILLLGLFALMIIGSMSVPVSGNAVYQSPDLVKTYSPSAATQVVFTAAGTGASGGGPTITPSYPASPTSGDLFLCVIMINNVAPAVTSVTDFTYLFGPYTQSTTERGWVYYKYSDGTETGTTTVTRDTGGEIGFGAKIFSFSNVHQTIGSAYEDVSYTNLGITDDIYDEAVTTSGTLSLAINIVFIGDDNQNPSSFTGETGGDWTQVALEFEWADGLDGGLDVQSATMASSGTVDGGYYDAGQNDPAGVLGFALLPDDSGGTPYSKDLTESVTAADTIENAAAYDRSYTESVGAVDVRTTAADMVRNLVESIGVVGVLTMLRGREKDLVETITASDVLTNAASYVRDLTESASVADTIAKAVGINMSEAITTVDIIDTARFITKDMVEVITASDVRTTAADYVRNRTESISAIDALSNAAAYVRDLVEAITAADTIEASKAIAKNMVEVISVAYVTSKDVGKNMIESITAADVRTLSADFVRDLVEAISCSDIIDAQKGGGIDYEKDLTEIIGVSPELTTVPPPPERSIIYELFLSLEVWGYLGPAALVIVGYVLSKKEQVLGVLWFLLECLVVSQYLLLVEATPHYWWHVYIILIGGLITFGFAMVGRRR